MNERCSSLICTNSFSSACRHDQVSCGLREHPDHCLMTLIGSEIANQAHKRCKTFLQMVSASSGRQKEAGWRHWTVAKNMLKSMEKRDLLRLTGEIEVCCVYPPVADYITRLPFMWDCRAGHCLHAFNHLCLRSWFYEEVPQHIGEQQEAQINSAHLIKIVSLSLSP